MRRFNSTIKVKQKICSSCGKPSFIFSKGRCEPCARVERVFADSEREIEQDEDLQVLINDADTLFSKWLRLSSADANGLVTCYTCNIEPIRWQESQCGHFIKRGCLYLRWDTRNTRIQCKTCNEYKSGNISVYAKRLEEEYSGITEILLEESYVIYKPTRHELKQLIADLSIKIKSLNS